MLKKKILSTFCFKMIRLVSFLFIFTQVNNCLFAQDVYGSQWAIWNRHTVLPHAQNAALSWMRIHPAIEWYLIEPVRNAGYNWENSTFDTYVTDAINSGIEPIMTIHGTPDWARKSLPGSSNRKCSPIDEAYISDYYDFVYATVNKYKSLGVTYWEIWNEPDAPIDTHQDVFGCWGAQSSDPAQQRAFGQYFGKFLAVAYDAVKAADPSAKVISGGLMMQLGNGLGGSDAPGLNFFEGVLQELNATGKQGFDIVAYHNYSWWYGPGYDYDLDYVYPDKPSRLLRTHRWLNELLANYGRSADIMMNEGALACSPTFQSTCTANAPNVEADKARHLVTSTTRAKSVDMLAYCWYTLDHPGWRMSGLLGPGQSPSTPTYNTLSTISPLLSGSEYMGKISNSSQPYEGYLLRKGSKDYRVYWTNRNIHTATELMPSGTSAFYKMNSSGYMTTPSIPTQASISFYPIIIESAHANIDIQAQSTYVLNDKLHQAFWRGNHGYYRQVPIVGGTPDWDNAPEFSGPIPASALPGSGDIQAQSVYILSGHLHQAFWRGNQGYYRQVPIVGGTPDWGNAPAFSGPIPISALPGSGNMQAQSTYIIGSKLHQAFWRGNQGYYRSVPIIGGTPDWSSAPPFNGPIPASALPGSNNMQAQSTYISGTTFKQAFWRGNGGYYRSAPIVGSGPNWAAATPFGGPIPANALPVGPN